MGCCGPTFNSGICLDATVSYTASQRSDPPYPPNQSPIPQKMTVLFWRCRLPFSGFGTKGIEFACPEVLEVSFPAIPPQPVPDPPTHFRRCHGWIDLACSQVLGVSFAAQKVVIHSISARSFEVPPPSPPLSPPSFPSIPLGKGRGGRGRERRGQGEGGGGNCWLSPFHPSASPDNSTSTNWVHPGAYRLARPPKWLKLLIC